MGLGLLAVDRLTKMVWGNSQNSGLYFWQVDQRVLIVFSLMIILGLWLWLVKVWPKAKKYLVLGLWLIILGGMSNVFDRIVYGYVIDWIHSPISVFNVADVMIVAGCGLVLLTGIDKI
ncbi:signal peptidase II [Patescibacteria group bacterium]